MPCSFIPPYLLRRLDRAGVLDRASTVGEHTLELDRVLRSRRENPPFLAAPADSSEQAVAGAAGRLVHTATNTETLPGALVRTDGGPATGDVAVDEAFDSSGQVLDLFAAQFDRRSIDGRGGPVTVTVTVHFGVDYDNAFWDGTQLVFGDGDGDGVIFDRFTKPMDVMAHEFTHGVTQFAAGLTYLGLSGALNESVSDVFAAMTKQRARSQTADQADWLVGEGLFRPPVDARALRSILEPGTAYDDPQLGFTWDRIGQVWYDALTAGEVSTRSDFVAFAQATLSSARRLFPDDPDIPGSIAAAWRTVGVLERDAPARPPTDTGAGPGGPPPATVAVRRSGGFTGAVRSGELDLEADPEGPELRLLLSRLQGQPLAVGPPTPDRFTYTLRYGEWQLSVPEPDLTPELRRVVSIVLSRNPPRGPGT